MILTKTWYETYNKKLLVTLKTFKIWKHYLEGCKYEVLMFIDYNNF